MEALWVVLLGAAALFVRLGQMAGAIGMARAKNAASAGVRSLADLCVTTLCFWAVGAAILFQMHNAVLGADPAHLIGWGGLSYKWFTMLVLVLIATGIVVPSLAERSTLAVPLIVSGLLAGLLVPMVMSWSLGGWLAQLGFVDAAGAAPIHLVPALAAMTAAVLVGPRDGKYNRDGSSNMIPGHSVPLMLIATMLTLVGWAPYVAIALPAGAPSLVPANVFIAAAAAGLTSLIIGRLRFGKTDVLLVTSGIIGGLVSITAAAASVRTPGAFLIGVIAGIFIPWLTVLIDVKLRIDDPGGFIAIHGAGGVWALVAAALFPPNTIADRIRILGVQALGIAVVAITVIAFTGTLLLILRAVTPLRSKEVDEYDGLDLAEHDINAHPDFQQTMIKSYHLREA